MSNIKTVSNVSECLYNVVLDNENSLNKKKPDNLFNLLCRNERT